MKTEKRENQAARHLSCDHLQLHRRLATDTDNRAESMISNRRSVKAKDDLGFNVKFNFLLFNQSDPSFDLNAKSTST